MAETALVISLCLLVLELRSAFKRKKSSWMLLMFAFNFIFIHGWILTEQFQIGAAATVNDPRVLVCIIINDVTLALVWILKSVFTRKNDNNLRKTIVTRSQTLFAMNLLFFFSLVMVGIYFATVGLSIFSDNIDTARHTAKKGYGYQLIFITHAIPMGVLYYFIKRDDKAATGQQKALFWLSFIGMCMIQIATGFRAYLLMSLVTLIMLYSEIRRDFSLRAFIALFGVGGALFAAITIHKLTVMEGDYGVVDALIQSVNHRVFMELPWAIEKLIQITDFNGYLYGLSYLWDLQSALPGPGESFGDKLIFWFNSRHELAGLAPITPSLIGEGYSNFGFFGVFLSSAFIGTFVASIDRWNPGRDLQLVVKMMVGFYGANAVMVGLGGFMSSRLLPLIFFLIILKGFSFIPAVSYYRVRNT